MEIVEVIRETAALQLSRLANACSPVRVYRLIACVRVGICACVPQGSARPGQTVWKKVARVQIARSWPVPLQLRQTHCEACVKVQPPENPVRIRCHRQASRDQHAMTLGLKVIDLPEERLKKLFYLFCFWFIYFLKRKSV